MPRLVLIVLAGPQASGKSSTAAALATALRVRGERVALVALDDIAAMALPTLPGWATASAVFEAVVGMWARSALTCVIAEGAGSGEEVRRLLELAPRSASTLTVAVDAPFEIALDRAQADPTRGISRSPEFLRGVSTQWAVELPVLDPDLTLPTGEWSIDRGVEAVIDRLDALRAESDR